MRVLLAPRWIVGHFLVLIICIGCLVAGFWQLDRLEQRRTANAVEAARYDQDPIPVPELVDLSGGDIDSLEYRRASASGQFLPEEEVLVRSQVFSGRAGFDVVTPLLIDEDTAVMVNRGWVPLEFNTTPVSAATPPEGSVTIEGVVRPSRERAAFGADDDADGDPDTVSRVDLDYLDEQVSAELLPVYLEATGEQDPTALPVPAAPPDFSDEGPHLEYAIQWFSFAGVGIVGYGFLLRRAIRRSSRSEADDDLHAGQPDQVGSA